MPTRLSIFIIAIALSFTASAGDWPMFLGPNGNGTADESNVPTQWGPGSNIKWKFALPSPGNSSPIVVGNKVFITCAEDEGKHRHLYCLDRDSGKLLWQRTASIGKVMPTHKTNSYSGSTPAAANGRVVTWESSAGLHCYDYAGKKLWQRDFGEFPHIWGYGSSPVIRDGRVYLHCGPSRRIFMTALSLDDGTTLWETPEPQDGDDDSKNPAGKYKGSWSTPIFATIGGEPQLICTMPTRVVGYDPKTGSILWWCNGISGQRGDLAYSSPIIGADIGVATGGYRGPSVGFKLGGSGDVTNPHRLWRNEENPQSIGTGIMIGDHYYMANAGPGTIQCINIKTGQEVWRHRARGGNMWGSIIHVDGRLYVTNQQGTTHVFAPNTTAFELLASNHLQEASNSTPAVSDGQIFIRTFKHLYCIED